VQFFIYRAMQIGILLLAAGTILGGVWPIIRGPVLGWTEGDVGADHAACYLALLHGSWRLWRGFGLAIGSVVCSSPS